MAVQDGKKMVRENQDSFRDPPKEVVVEKQGGFAKHFHYIKVDVPGHLTARGEPLCPALPLSSAWLEEDDSKKANKVEIVFPAHTGTQISCVAECSYANPSPQNS
jgi:hypothetical protein